jgi:hypothetical protein
VAEERYLSTDEDRKEVHELLADYFEGEWATNPIAYYDKHERTKKFALRYVAVQPYVSNSSIPCLVSVAKVLCEC